MSTTDTEGKHRGQKAVTLWLDQSLLARIDDRIAKDLSSLPGATLSRQAIIKAAIEAYLGGVVEPDKVEVNVHGAIDAERALKEAQTAFTEALGKQGKVGSRV